MKTRLGWSCHFVTAGSLLFLAVRFYEILGSRQLASRELLLGIALAMVFIGCDIAFCYFFSESRIQRQSKDPSGMNQKMAKVNTLRGWSAVLFAASLVSLGQPYIFPKAFENSGSFGAFLAITAFFLLVVSRLIEKGIFDER